MSHTPLSSLLTGCAAASLLACAVPAAAQKAAAASAAPRCAALLTADEVKAAVGMAMEDLGPVARGEGETECGWMLRGAPGGLKTVAVSFYDQHAIKASPTASTGDAFFEMVVKAAEESTSAKREMIAGVGQHAAFVPTDPQTLAVVHRADGVARIVANGLTKAQTIAIAKAVAAP
jgi:hypothetical protein